MYPAGDVDIGIQMSCQYSFPEFQRGTTKIVRVKRFSLMGH